MKERDSATGNPEKSLRVVERINELKWAKEITAERMQGLMEEQELGGGGDVLNERGRNYS